MPSNNTPCIETSESPFWAGYLSNIVFTAYSTYLFTNNNAFNDRHVYTNAMIGWSSTVQLLVYGTAIMHNCDTQYYITAAYRSGTMGILIGDLMSALAHKNQDWHEKVGLALLISLGIDRVNGFVAEFLSDVVGHNETVLTGSSSPEHQDL